MHPLVDFSYCPRCGASGLETREHRAIYCPSCSFLFFGNAAAAVGAFIFHGEEVVLAVRAKEPAAGKLDLPGGFTEYGEALEDAVIREVKEELNLDVVNLNYLGSAPNQYRYKDVCYWTLDAVFTCRADSLAGLKADDDVADFRVVRPSDIDPNDLAFESSRAALRHLLKRLDKGVASC